MLDVVKVASYISRRYEQTFGVRIDEMKLHKLLYFVQRETLIQTKVFEQYAAKDAWTLSSITHGEKSWIKAREGVSPDKNSSALIDINDIRIDAHYIKLRRLYLSKLQPA